MSYKLSKISNLTIGSKISTMPSTITNIDLHYRNIMTVSEIINIDNITYYRLISDILDNINYTLSTQALTDLILKEYLTIIDDYFINATKINKLTIGSNISTIPVTINNLNDHYLNLMTVIDIIYNDDLIIYIIKSNIQDNIIYTLSTELLRTNIYEGRLTIIDEYFINILKINELNIGSTISTMPVTINNLNLHYRNLLIITEIINIDNIIYYTLESNLSNKTIYILNSESIKKLILKDCLTIM
jgi:hypothetical protein